MKTKLVLGIGALLCLPSCYCNKIAVGNVDPHEKLVHVASERNQHYLGGLFVSHSKTHPYVPGVENYVIETKHTFWDCVVALVTCSIYTPNTTKYYVPASNPRVVVEKEKYHSKAAQGYLKE